MQTKHAFALRTALCCSRAGACIHSRLKHVWQTKHACALSAAPELPFGFARRRGQPLAISSYHANETCIRAQSSTSVSDVQVQVSHHACLVSSNPSMHSCSCQYLSCFQALCIQVRASTHNCALSSSPSMHSRSGQRLSCFQVFCVQVLTLTKYQANKQTKHASALGKTSQLLAGHLQSGARIISQLFHTISIIKTCALKTSPQLLSRLLRACVRKLSPLLHAMQTSHALALRTVPSAASRPPCVKACVHPITNAHSPANQPFICDKDSI